MDAQLRRSLPRQFANWGGTYVIESEPEMRWRDCRVVDISSIGAGFELRDAPLQAPEGQHIFAAVHLRGEIRNSRRTDEGRLRVGTQFVDIADEARASLRSLTGLDVRW
ncbi:MAG TPA: PilZ domain-containing protein [Acidimicrobiales bacterium]